MRIGRRKGVIIKKQERKGGVSRPGWMGASDRRADVVGVRRRGEDEVRSSRLGRAIQADPIRRGMADEPSRAGARRANRSGLKPWRSF